MSTIYQEINAVPLISVARNLFMGREPRNRLGLIDIKKMNHDAAAVLHEYGIDIDVRDPLRMFRVGTQQMVAIARAMLLEARVVIMDEPTSALEPREVATLFRTIDRLRAGGVAVVYVSHRLDELYQVCQRVTIMRDGRLVHSAEITDLPRLKLVSMMLGRDMNEAESVRAHRFGVGESAPPDVVLDAAHLTRRHVLHDVSFSARRGEIVGLAGLLGAGRTETIKAIAGAQQLDAGTISVNGNSVPGGNTRGAIRSGIALVPEDRKTEGLMLNLSVRDNIVLAALPGLSRWGLVRRRRQAEIVEEFIRRLRIKVTGPNQRVGDLSGGNQQKVLLARAMCLHPQVLLLDDPTRGIDVGAKADIQALIESLATDGLSIVLASSEFAEVIAGSHRVVVLREGERIGELSGGEITEQGVINLIAAAKAHDDQVDPGAPTAGASSPRSGAE